MPNDSGQKIVGRNNGPRVQIEYEVERYGAQKLVQLPFMVGVMSDLSGKSTVKPPPLAERRFSEVNRGNFDSYMATIKPRAVLDVANRLTGHDKLNIALEFQSMADFEPDAVAAKVPVLNELLRARTLLNNLIRYMDGKSDAEAMVEAALKDPAFLQALASGAVSSPVPVEPAADAAENGVEG